MNLGLENIRSPEISGIFLIGNLRLIYYSSKIIFAENLQYSSEKYLKNVKYFYDLVDKPFLINNFDNFVISVKLL